MGYKHTHILLLSVFCDLGNHSCVPNAETSFPENNFLLHVTALEDIKPGEVRGPGSRGGHKGLAASLYEAAVTSWSPFVGMVVNHHRPQALSLFGSEYALISPSSLSIFRKSHIEVELCAQSLTPATFLISLWLGPQELVWIGSSGW